VALLTKSERAEQQVLRPRVGGSSDQVRESGTVGLEAQGRSSSDQVRESEGFAFDELMARL
jgi:hypothetical protein